MRSFPRLTVFILLMHILVGNAAGQVEKHLGEATVHIVAVDNFGDDLGESKIESFKDVDYGHELARRFHENTASKIPYSVYSLLLSHRGFESTKRTVYVFNSDVWVLVGIGCG